jgi:protein-tyrosine phosphatase
VQQSGPMAPPAPYRVLFVCTGNICRSPLAEALFAHFVREDGLGDRFLADSAGLGGWHIGDRADPRTRRVAEGHGVPVPSRARQFDERDFDRFDLILAMDRDHLADLQSLARGVHRSKVRLMRDYDRQENHGKDVPDPYYGGTEGFEAVHQMLAVSCRNLLETLKVQVAAAHPTA